VLQRLNLDQTNILLMLASLGVAYVIPFELVLLSYAFLGPAHYLTEISWLHDRSYFTDSKWVWAPLMAMAVLISALGWNRAGDPAIVFAALATAIALSVGFALAKEWKARVAVVAALAGGLIASNHLYPDFGLALAILIPTVVHIYVFTGLFILSGAMKSGSAWGYASFAVFLFCGVFFFFVTPGITMISTDFVDKNLSNFDGLVDYIVSLIAMEGRVNAHAVLAFLSFAYTYHYLNWFSKTEIIKWHLIPRRRLYVIIAFYVAAVSLYLVDFRTGFLVLSFLSLAHVVLEFPLNALSVKMIGQGLFGRRKVV
jgi:hypothetical protein